jgi:4-hydroxybenzoyl-CoA thioesterase
MTQIVMPMHTNGVAGVMFGGIMMQWIDVCAGVAAMRHASGAVLTASIDRLDFLSPVRVGEIVVLQAQVNYAGKTSMEVGCRVETEDMRSRSRRYTTKAYLTFVAVDQDGRPTPVPEWHPTDGADRELQASAIRRIDLRAEIEAAMAAQTYSDEGIAPRIVLRFLAAPSDVNWGGKVHGGIVMRWIDEAAHVLATQWNSSPANIAVYAGGVRFYRPLRIGDLVEVEARLLHTGTTSMHISVHVRSGDPALGDLKVTTHCLIIFVSLDANGEARLTHRWAPVTAEDQSLERHALHLAQLRAAVDQPAATTP